MAEFASKGVAGTALGTGIAGLSLGVLNGMGGLLGGLNNNYNHYNGYCSDDHLVNRYDLGKDQKIAKLETEIALRDSNIYTDQKIADVFERLNTRIVAMDKDNCEKRAEQGIINAKVDSGLTLLGSQVGSINQTLSDLTKTVIPNSSICPGWGDVKVCVIPCDPQPTAKK